MSTTSPAPAPAHRRSVAVIAIIATILTAVGGVAVAAGLGLLIAFRSGGIDTGPVAVSTPTAAVVAPIAHTNSVGTITGPPTLRLSIRGANPARLFVGVGSAVAVGRYLAGVAVDRITELTDRAEPGVERAAGTAAAAPPIAQNFWVASTTNGDLSWRIQNGDYRVVVMNADGTPGVNGRARMQITLPNAVPASLVVLASGLIVTAGGIVLLAMAVTRRRA